MHLLTSYSFLFLSQVASILLLKKLRTLSSNTQRVFQLIREYPRDYYPQKYRQTFSTNFSELHPPRPTMEGGGKRQKRVDTALINNYSGYSIKDRDEYVPRIPSITSPQDFFASYILPRRPCIVTGGLTDEAWAGDKWSNRYLSEVAGDKVVRVERRREKKDVSGEGDVSSSLTLPLTARHSPPPARFAPSLDTGPTTSSP